MKKHIIKILIIIVLLTAMYFTYINISKIQTGSEEEITMNDNRIYEQLDNINVEKSNETDLFYNSTLNMPNDTLIKIFKSKRVLELYGDNVLIGRFKIALGGSPIGDKNVEGDLKTPVGSYYICTRNENSIYTLFLGISYPNSSDAQRGYENNLIDVHTLNNIKETERLGLRPPWHTPLGGEVGIHGGGNITDWTLGCVALSNEDIKIIWQFAPMNTPVEIYE